MEMLSVDAVCPDCKGTGLYVIKTYPEGQATVCIKCNGNGYTTLTLEFERFSGTKTRVEGISLVGSYVPGNFERVHQPISYEDFFNGERPPIFTWQDDA